MEKLIELLNEYNCDVLWLADNREYKDYMWWIRLTSVWAWKIYLYVISKEYWFIKWLVDNDKIDVESYCRITSVERKWEKDVYRDEVDSLLMLLAIQDEPIEFLISILK